VRVAALRAVLDGARDDDDGSADRRRAHIDATCALIVALVDELEEESADIELAGLWPLVEHDRRLEIEVRRALAAEMSELGERGRAVELLRTAHALAVRTRHEDEADIAIDLADAQHHHTHQAEAKAVLSATETIATRAGATPEIAARLELGLARAATGDVAEGHARAALAQAGRAGDVVLLHEAARELGELLVARDAFTEAETLLEELPPLDEARETRALLEEIWRRLGSHLEDEADEADEPGEMERQLRAYITKPVRLAQTLVDGGLVSPDRIREWSYGELREPADLESQRVFGPVRSFWCACGRYRGRAYAGIVCRRCGVEVIHAASRRMRTGHIVLSASVVHPWYAAAAAQLLGVPIEGMLVEELRVALLALDLDRIAEDVKREIVTAPKAKIADAAGRRLALVDAFRTARTQAYTQPVHVILDILPVVPPHGELGCERAPVRAAYARILEGEDPKTGVQRLFDALSAR
jgi:hypothetical protein